MESDSANTPMSEINEPKPKNFFDRLLGTYFSPADTFREIGRSPAVLMPIIALIVFGFLQGFYLSKYFDMESMFANNPAIQSQTQGEMTPEQKERAEQQIAVIAKFMKVFVLVSTGVGTLLFALIIAGVFRLVSKVVGAENSFKAVFCVTTYVMLAVGILSFALLALVASFKDPSELTYANMRSLLSSNLGAILGNLLGEDILPKYFMKLLGYVDVFAVWYIALLSIGYAAVSRKLKTATVATWFSILYGIIAVIGAAIG